MELQPKDIVLGWNNVQAFARDKFRPKPKEYVHSAKYTEYVAVPQAMTDWAASYIDSEEELDRPLTLIVWGPSKTGKTAWARHLGMCLFMVSLLPY